MLCTDICRGSFSGRYFMSVNSKHMATFLLGAAAAFGAYKYSKLSDEGK